MRIDKKAQMTMITLVTISLLVLSILSVVLMVFREIHSTALADEKSQTLVNVMEAIRADLKRLLAMIMANASQMYAFHPYIHNLTLFRLRTNALMNNWTDLVSRKYGALVQIGQPGGSFSFEGKIFQIPPGNSTFKLYWYRPVSATIGRLNATISISHLGIRGAVVDAYVGLFMAILNITSREGEIDIYLKIMVDEGVPVADIRGVNLTILYPDLNYYWRKAEIVNYRHVRRGIWCITILNSTTAPIYRMGVAPQDPDGVIPLRIYAIDWRGIVVSSLTYSGILLRIEKNTPDKLYYYNSTTGSYVELDRGETPDEIYTIEIDWNFTLHFLLNEIPLDYSSINEKPPPLPPIPVKQLRVYTSSDLSNWRLTPFQSEYWRKVNWYGHRIWVPESPANPVYWFNRSCRLVFQVGFRNTAEKVKYVKITWEMDCDADIIVWPTSLRYVYNPPEYKDVVSETFVVELIDTEHTTMRDFDWDYRGAAALGFRDPDGTFFGPTDLHAVDQHGRRPGKYRPYGKWKVFSNYIGPYWQVKLPVRMLIMLNTSKVISIYDERDKREDYYATLAIVYLINNSRHMVGLMHIHWQDTKTFRGAWMFISMGGGVPEKYMYMRLKAHKNETKVGEYEDIPEIGYAIKSYKYPNFFSTHWDNGIGRAAFLSESAVHALYTIGGSSDWDDERPRFAVTRYVPYIPERKEKFHSLEYEFVHWDPWDPPNPTITFPAGTYYSYWFVIYMYQADEDDSAWLRAYKYAPMFLESYAPSISVVEIGEDW